MPSGRDVKVDMRVDSSSVGISRISVQNRPAFDVRADQHQTKMSIIELDAMIIVCEKTMHVP